MEENKVTYTIKYDKDKNQLDFDDILEFWPYNRTVYEELKNNLSDIVPMVGAGLSQSITKDGETFATWEGLLKQCASNMGTKEKNVIEWEIDNGRYEEAAEKLAEIVGERALLTYIKQTFNSEKIDLDKLKKSAIADAVKLFGNGLILTTNYDKAIELAYENIGRNGGIEVLLPSSPKKDFVRVARKSSECSALYKFHGDIEKGWEDIIFTNTSYKKAYGENHSTELVQNLSFCLLTHPILFLGCSLKRDRIMNLLIDNKEGSHFAFVACGSSKKEKFDPDTATEEAISKSAELDKMGIMPIFYPRYDRKCINELLKQLMKDKISKEEVGPLNVLYYQVADEKEKWISEKLLKLDENTNKIVFFGGITSALRKFSEYQTNYKALNTWLSNNKEAHLYYCYEYGEAAKNRISQVKESPNKSKEKSKEKMEEIINIPNLFPDTVKERIHMIPLTYTLTGYPIIIGEDLFWNIILDGRSSSTAVLLVKNKAISKYKVYMKFALQMSKEKLTLSKEHYSDCGAELSDITWDYLCPSLFETDCFNQIIKDMDNLDAILM